VRRFFLTMEDRKHVVSMSITDIHYGPV
jgi:hypothetical protein